MGIYTKSGDEKIYTFSSKPRIPGHGTPDVLVKFQIVSRTQPCSSHHYFKLNSHTKLSKVRTHIYPLFKNFFNDGFIFLSKTKEILRTAENSLTVFDILPKLPAAGAATPFLFPDVQYKEISHDVDGVRHLVTCACVVFVYEASKVSQWDAERLRDDLSASTIEGFSFIPTDIMSWRQAMVECRASTLHQQAAIGAKDDVKTSLQHLPYDFRINSLKDQRGANPLHYAAENGHLEVCEILITGIGRELVNQRDFNLRTPLHCALYRKNVSTITYLLQLSSNFTSKDIHGNSCLELLERQKSEHLKLILTELQFECTEPILQYSLAQLHLQKKHSKLIYQISQQLRSALDDPETWRYLLYYAAEIGNKEIAENLIERGCDIRTVDVQGLLPFHHACMTGNKYIDIFFYKEMTDDDFYLGLMIAVKKKHYSLCQKIRQLKPEVKLDENTMCTIIEILDAELEKVRYSKQLLKSWEEIAKCLLPVVAEDKGVLNTFVFDCAYYGSVDILSLLQSLGASFTEQDHMGRTPLHESCQRNHIQTVEILLDAGANPNATDWRGSTSLHYACAKGNDKIVCRLLKEDSVSADIQDNSGRTPLLIAAYNNRHDTMFTLLKSYINRINIHATDVLGHSILHYAVHMKAKCLDLLFEQLQKSDKSTTHYSNFANAHKDWTDEIKYDYWYRKLWMSDFSSNDDWKLMKEQSKSMSSRDQWNELMRQKQIKLFGNKRERAPWARPDVSPKEPRMLEKAALRKNQHNLLKKIDRLDPELKNLRDCQNRSPLWFAVDIGNKSGIKTSYELNSRNLETGLVYHVILQMIQDSKLKYPKRKEILDFLLSIGGSADDTIGIGESVFEMQGGIVKDFLAIEFCVFIGDTNLFELLLDKSAKCNENYCIGLALSKGNLGIIDLLVKRREKLGKPMLSRHEIGPILDVACGSKFLSMKMVDCLLRICPDAVYNNINADDNVRLVGCNIAWSIVSAGSTFGSLLSKISRRDGKISKSEIEKIGKFLINHGINLDNCDSDLDMDVERHFCCEAYYSAVKNEYYNTASLILETAGHAVWNCAFLGKKCHYFQNQNKTEVSTDGHTLNQESQEEALKKHIRIGSQRHVPEIFLKNLLISGKEFMPRMSKATNEEKLYEDDISLETSDEDENETESLGLDSDKEEKLDRKSEKKEKETGSLEEYKRSPKTGKKNKTIKKLENKSGEATIVKKLSFLLSAIDGHEVDISRLLRFVPELFMCDSFFKNMHFQEPGIRSKNNFILLAMAKNKFYRQMNRKHKCTSLTLLHYISYTDNVHLIKDLQMAAFPIDVNAKAGGSRPIDLAATAGSYNAYKTLIENGATVTGKTFVACFERGYIPDFMKYLLIRLRGNECNDEGTRLKIIKDIFNRKDSNALIKKHLIYALNGLLTSEFWQILQFFVENHTKETFDCLKRNKHIGEKLFQKKIPDNLLQIMIEACIAKIDLVNEVVFAQMLLCTSRKTNENMLLSMINKIGDRYTKEEWKYILREYDRNGFSTLHNVVRNGFIGAAIALLSRVGSYRSFSCEDSKPRHRTEQPIWYSLAYQQWDMAKVLLYFNCESRFTNVVSHLYMKGRFMQKVVEEENPLIDVPHCYWQYRKPFPHLTNTSHSVASAIAPNIPCFGVRENNVLCLKQKEKRLVQRVRQRIDLEDKEKRFEAKQLLLSSKIARKYGCSLIHVLCATGNIKAVKELQSYIPSEWNIKDENGLHPIIYAVAGGKIDVINAVNCDLDTTNALEMVWVCLWKIMTLGQDQSNRIKVMKKDRFDIAIDNLQPLVPNNDEKEGTESIEKERILSLITAVKNAKYKVCQEGFIPKSTWFMTSGLENINGGDNLEAKVKSLLKKGMRNLDIGRLQPVLWISVLASQPWVLQTLIDIWLDDNIFVSKITGKFFGMFSLIDMIIICAEPANQEDLDPDLRPYGNITSKLLSKSNIPIKDEIILLAAKKNLWDILEEIVRKTVHSFSDVTNLWHKVLIQSIKNPNGMSFLRTFVESINLYKLEDEVKKVFHAYECLASLYKRDDVIRYLFKCHIPICRFTRDMNVLRLCKSHFPDEWNILHYTLRGESVSTLDVILRFLRYDVGFLKSSNLTGLVSMSFTQRNSDIQERLIAFLQKYLHDEVLAIDWNVVFLNVAKHGNQISALQLMDEKRIDFAYCDKEKRNVLHYAAILGLSKLVDRLMKTNTSRDLHTLDQHDKYPIDYAILFGHADVIQNIFAISQEISSTIDRFFYGCLRGILETNYKDKKDSDHILQNEIESTKLQFKLLENESFQLLEDFVKSSNDRSACFLVEKYPHVTKEIEFRIFHLAVRYKCSNTIEALLKLTDKELIERALIAEFQSLTPLAWAIQGHYIKGVQLLTEADKEKVSLEWRASKTGETILHLAVKTADREIVKIINDWSEKSLQQNADNSGLTPSALAVALGGHHILPCLTSDVIYCQNHASHDDENTDFTCLECLLDLCVGWNKMHHFFKSGNLESTLGQNTRSIPETYYSERGFAPVRRLQFKRIGYFVGNDEYHYNRSSHTPPFSEEYFMWPGSKRKKIKITMKTHSLQSMMEWTNWDSNHPFVLSMIKSMGYEENSISVKNFFLALDRQNTKTCPEQKMLRSILYATSDNKFSISDPKLSYQLYETAASTGLKHIFEHNADHFSRTLQNINTGQVINSHGFTLSEIAFGFGHCELGLYLETFLIQEGKVDIYTNLRNMVPALPTTIGWLICKDDSTVMKWDIEKEFDEDNRLKTPEMILVSPWSGNVIDRITKSIDIKGVIPSTCRGKKFQPDIESFKKQQCFNTKSDLWFHCLMGSSLIYGRAFSLLHNRDPKIFAASSVQIRCLPEESSEHPKFSLETNGVITETVGITKTVKSFSFEYDKLPNQRSTDAEFKQAILSEVIPDIESKLLDVFGHNISIKVDWRSIESQRRTSGSINIFNLLRNGNRLAGLEDVIDHCRWLKDELTGVFCEKTVDYALAPMSTVHEITVKYVDTLPSADSSPSPKYSSMIPNCVWNFTINRSTLIFDRTTFPLWNHLHLYNGICHSLLYATKMIHFKQVSTLLEKSTVEKPPFIELEIDIKSFGAYSIPSLHTLIARKIEYEMSHIGHLLHTMLRLSLSAKHVVIQNASSSKYTGLSLKGDKMIISIYAHQHKSNEWTVSSENAYSTLLDLEDRHLSAGITTTLLEGMCNTVKRTQEQVFDQVGLQLKISLDEKKLLSTVFQRYRRDMEHPYELIEKSMKTIQDYIPPLYDEAISRLLYSPSSLFCRLACNRTKDMTDQHQSVYTWKRCSTDSEISTNQNILSLIKTTYLYPVYFNRISFKLLDSSEVPSYPKETKRYYRYDCYKGRKEDIICQWKVCDSQFSLASVRRPSCEFLSHANSNYQILDNLAIYNALKSINCQFVIHDLVVDALENGFQSTFKDKLLPNFNASVSNIRLPKNLTTQYWSIYESSLESHGFKDVHPLFLSVEWRSFCLDTEEMIQSEHFLKNAIDVIINVFFYLCKKFGFTMNEYLMCLLQEEQHNALKTVMSSFQIYLRRIKTDDDKNKQKANIENLQKPKAENVELLWVPGNKVEIGIHEELDYTSCTIYIQSAIIRGLELEILNLLYSKVMNNDDSNDDKILKLNDKDSQTIDQRKGKMNLELILQVHFNLKEALTTFTEMPLKSLVSNLNDVHYVKSKVTSMNFLNGCLKILVSPSDVSKSTLLKGLKLALIQEVETMDLLDTISFQQTGPEMYFSSAAENIIRLTVSDSNGNKLSDAQKDLVSSKDSYLVRILECGNEIEDEIFKTALKVDSVDLSDDELTMRWKYGEVKYKGIAKIQVTIYGRCLDLPSATLIFGNSNEFSQGISLTKRKRIHLEKGGFFVVMLEHDTGRYVTADDSLKSVHSCIPSKKDMTFKNWNYTNERFEVFTRVKKFYSNTKSAIIIRSYQMNGNWRGIYTVSCTNPQIDTRIRAVCCLCGRYLRMITPHRVYEPAEEILIN
ncbi:hypothetical protein KUTeg_016796 [Tegillarca granosa]|uniref:Uncharacterized protein n=1 Tax=Tegillarca granosa TaxID=220873 RepID=A0ABQ9EQU2_TEGGR|nr:hypothetical protein KUTeg_016796 [Tegillarca granosa]